MRLGGFLIAAALALAATAAPALAADIATLPCVQQQLSAETREAIAETARRSAEGEMGVRTGDEARTALAEAAVRCQTKYGWTEEETKAAGMHTLATLRLAAMEPIAKSKGVDTAMIKTAVAAMTPDEREMMRTGERAGSEALLRELEALGVSVPADFATAQLYGRLATIFIVMESFRKTFTGA